MVRDQEAIIGKGTVPVVIVNMTTGTVFFYDLDCKIRCWIVASENSVVNSQARFDSQQHSILGAAAVVIA